MSWISRLLRYLRKQKHLDRIQAPCWKVSCTKDYPSFLRALVALVPAGSVLYIEGGGTPPSDVKFYLEERPAQETFKIPGGTLLPTPKVFHMPITKENLDGLADLEGKYPTPVGSIHVHVYKEHRVLLQSYDAFLAPFYISKEIPQDKVKEFCNKIGSEYE